jgi:tetratricopeptide (TPR) repeat protein
MARNRKRNDAKPVAATINQRVRELVGLHSLSDVARRTGTPVTSVHRYLNGGRVPGDFCARLTEAYALNPAWLLLGKGRPNIADVTPDTADMAGNLLELIRAMAAVEQMQLGALTGKHHLRVLRELSDAMARYEALRQRLHQTGAPVLRRILDDLKRAIDRRDVDRAEELSRTADQLGRFCDEPALALEAAVLQGRLAAMTYDLSSSLAMTRKVAQLALHHPHLLGERELGALAETAQALFNLGRFGEARRIAEAALTLAPDELQRSQACRQLTLEIGAGQVHTGELKDGLAKLIRVQGILTGAARFHAHAVVVRAMLLAGLLDIPAAIALGEHSEEKAWLILGVALFLENEPDLAAALDYTERTLPAVVPGAGPKRWWPMLLTLQVLRGQKAGLLEKVREVENTEQHRDRMPLDWRPIFAAQMYRLMKRLDDARRCQRQACRALKAVPPGFTISVLWQARHERNALELGNKREQRQAREWFQRHVELGYRCFAHLV